MGLQISGGCRVLGTLQLSACEALSGAVQQYTSAMVGGLEPRICDRLFPLGPLPICGLSHSEAGSYGQRTMTSERVLGCDHSGTSGEGRDCFATLAKKTSNVIASGAKQSPRVTEWFLSGIPLSLSNLDLKNHALRSTVTVGRRQE